jgi:NADH-quinone oxidoreductase subunit L
MGLTVLLAAAGFAVAYTFYQRNPELADQLAVSFHRPYQLLLHKYYVDEIYESVVIRPLHWLSERILWRGVDMRVIDGAVNGVAVDAQDLGGWVRRLQSGNTRSYAAWILLGAAATLSFLILAFRDRS